MVALRLRIQVVQQVALAFVLAATGTVWGAGAALPREGGAFGPLKADESAEETPAANASESATTHAAYSLARYDRTRQGLVEVYERTSDDAPALRARASQWLVDICKADADLGGCPPWAELYARGDAILADGCVHPVVVSYAAHDDLVRGRLGRSRERHDLVSAPLLAGEYGTLARYYEAFRIMRLDYLLGRGGPRVESEHRTVEALLALAVEETDPVRQRMLWEDFQQLTGQAWDRDAAEQLIVAASTDERIDPWLRAMLAGKEAQQRAWRARGGSYASEVDEKRWKPFYDAIADAKSHYRLAYELEPDHPEAATELIGVAMADPDGEFEDLRNWFDEARAAQVDYLPAYTALLWAMRPRWHGSHGAMYALAQEWADEARFDTNAPYMAAQAVFDIGSEMGGYQKALEPAEPYQLVMSLMQRMADDPAHSAASRRTYTRRVLLTHQVAAAIQAGREADARRALETLWDEGFTVDDTVVRHYDLQPELHIPRLIARTGPAAEMVQKLGAMGWYEKRGDQATRAASVTAYQEAKRLTDDPRADAYFDYWSGLFSMEIDFYDGKWVAPHFDDRFADWYRPIEGLWEVEDATTAVARQSDNSGAPLIWTACHLSTPYEVEVEVEPFYETGGAAWTGVYAGDNEAGVYCCLNRTRPAVSIRMGEYRSQIVDIPAKDRYLLSVRVWPGYVEMRVDGERRLGEQLKDFKPSGYFALAAAGRTGHAAEVRYRNPRFRKLEPRPTEADEPDDEPEDGAVADSGD